MQIRVEFLENLISVSVALPLSIQSLASPKQKNYFKKASFADYQTNYMPNANL
jgi:hypothetical protein